MKDAAVTPQSLRYEIIAQLPPAALPCYDNNEAAKRYQRRAASNHSNLSNRSKMAEPYIPYDGPVVTRDEARALGLNRYYIGACKYGHLFQRSVSDTKCLECSRLYRLQNIEKLAAKSRAHYQSNKESVAEKNKKWRLNNIDKVRRLDALAKAVMRASDPKSNRDGVKSWRLRFPEKSRAISREYRKNNPLKAKAADHNKRARIALADGRHTADDIQSILKAQRGRCAYCREKLGNSFHVDHIIPISKGGSNWPSNIQVTCQPCNQKKHAKDPIVFAQENGLLV